MTMVNERPRISGFTELSEGSKAGHAFDWERDYAPAYRQCPSAFWLAPDAADVMPKPDLIHPRPIAARAPVEPDASSAVERVSNRALGATSAVLLAGPIFISALTLTSMPVFTTPGINAGALLIVLLTIPFGLVLSALPIAIGSFVMGKLGEVGTRWRHPFAWVSAGAVFGMAIALMFDSDAEGIAVMAITGGLCAWLARWGVRWGVQRQPARNALTPAVAINACPPK